MKNGFSRGSRQQANVSRPEGFSALRMLANDTTGSDKNITPKREASNSKRAGSNGYTVASASAKSTGSSFGALARARASIGADMSIPNAWPEGATFRANAIV